jgi:hypothetical protein
MRTLILLVYFMFAIISLDAVWKQCGAATYDATGTWNYSTTGNWATGCAADANRTSTASVNQTGNSVTVVDNWTGVTYTGTVSGANYSVSAIYPEDGGIVTDNINFTLSSATLGSGIITWSWTDGFGFCNGGATITISRIGSPPSVTVTSPNGGENWLVGTSRTITWNSSGNPGNNVRIEYSTNGGSSWNNIISSTANDGSYSWTVPNTPTTSARVRVTSTSNSSNIDTSNSNFTIYQPTIVWVDFTYTGTESGTQAEPYNTLAEAINAVAVGGEIIIKGGVTSETFTGLNKIDKEVTIKSSGGTATIGKQ